MGVRTVTDLDDSSAGAARAPGAVPPASRASPVDDRFQRFYTEHFAATTRLVRFLTGDVSAAEDLAQEAFVRVYRYGERSGRNIDNPAALLRTTTVNLCRSWHTSQRRAELRMVRHGPDADTVTAWERELELVDSTAVAVAGEAPATTIVTPGAAEG